MAILKRVGSEVLTMKRPNVTSNYVPNPNFALLVLYWCSPSTWPNNLHAFPKLFEPRVKEPPTHAWPLLHSFIIYFYIVYYFHKQKISHQSIEPSLSFKTKSNIRPQPCWKKEPCWCYMKEHALTQFANT